ncbi:MAG: coiled-coil protein [Promethearchaeota archaeon]
MSAEKATEQIFKLRDELTELSEKRETLLTKVRKLEKERDTFREERNRLNTVAADCFKQVRELKEKRDDNNKEISELKETRQSVLEEMRLMIKRAQELKGHMTEDKSEARKKRVNSRRLERSIDELDWKLQTTPGMNIEEERQLVEKVSHLMVELDSIRMNEGLHRELKKLNSDIKNLKGFLDDSWGRFSELVGASQARHQRLTDLYNQGKEAKEQADHNHQIFLKKAEEVRSVREQLRETQGQLRKKYQILKDRQTERKVRTRQIREERESRRIAAESKRIFEKYKKGEKLSIEEMRILLDTNLLSLSEEGEEE